MSYKLVILCTLAIILGSALAASAQDGLGGKELSRQKRQAGGPSPYINYGRAPGPSFGGGMGFVSFGASRGINPDMPLPRGPTRNARWWLSAAKGVGGFFHGLFNRGR